MTHEEFADAIEQGRFPNTINRKHICLELGRFTRGLDKVEVFEVIEEREKSVIIKIVSRAIGDSKPFCLPRAAFYKFVYDDVLHLQQWFYDKMSEENKKNLTLSI